MKYSIYVWQAMGFAAVAILFLVGCTVEPNIQEVSYQDVQFNDTFEPVPEVIIHSPCFEFNDITFRTSEHEEFGQGLVIQNEAEYQKLNEFKINRESCENRVLPSIDLKSKTLIGKYVRGNCAATGFNKIVTIDLSKKQYHVHTEQTTHPGIARCSGMGISSMNWILVDKIPEDYTVVFS